MQTAEPHCTSSNSHVDVPTSLYKLDKSNYEWNIRHTTVAKIRQIWYKATSVSVLAAMTHPFWYCTLHAVQLLNYLLLLCQLLYSNSCYYCVDCPCVVLWRASTSAIIVFIVQAISLCYFIYHHYGLLLWILWTCFSNICYISFCDCCTVGEQLYLLLLCALSMCRIVGEQVYLLWLCAAGISFSNYLQRSLIIFLWYCALHNV